MEQKESEVAQSCPTLCDPVGCSLPGSSVHGIFQAIVLELIAISFSRASSQPRDQTQVSHTVDRRFTVWTTREDNRTEAQAKTLSFSGQIKHGWGLKQEPRAIHSPPKPEQLRRTWDLPSGPVVKTPCFQGRGRRLIPGWETKISYAAQCGQKYTRKKKKKRGWLVLTGTPQVRREKNQHRMLIHHGGEWREKESTRVRLFAKLQNLVKPWSIHKLVNMSPR